MSAFECNVTPTRFRKEQKRSEDREPTFVDLRPFSGKSIVTFEDVPVSKSARRLIVISNPFDEVLKVSVTKQPKPEFNVTLEWSINKIPPQSQKNLEIVWNPVKAVGCREVIQISDENGNKKDISVILKSCELKKCSSKRMGPASFPKKLKLKTPSPPQTFVRSVSTPKTKKSATQSMKECQENHLAQVMTTSPLRNSTNLRQQQDLFDRINFSTCIDKALDKENSAPETPKTASALFDNIRFTPHTETKPKCESKLEYLSSLPTPLGTKRDDIVLTDRATRRNLMDVEMSPEVTSRQSLSRQPTPQARVHQREVIPTIEYNLVKETTTIHGQTFVANDDRIEDEINEIEIVLDDQRSMLGNTRVISTTPLCVISEEEQLVTRTEFHKTFEVNKFQSLSSVIAADSSERIASESMQEIYPERQKFADDVQKLRANQGSMPNLNQMNISVGSIEHNRYFRQQQVEHRQQNLSIESVVSNADFRETEICAQSSRYNLNVSLSPSNLDKSKTDSPIKSKIIRSVMVGDSPVRCVQASIHSSPTMRRIHQEPEFGSPPKKNFQMTFSPPARSKLSADVRMMQRRETIEVPSGGRTIRATTWKQQQNQEMFAIPKVPRDLNLRSSTLVTQSLNSLSSSSLASVGSTCSTPASLTRGRLYNENHLNVYNRKDPFSATTTNDPFLSSTMYLDEQTLDNIEKTYKKWLNALVTIPADLETDKNEKIDVGKLFNDVQTKELALAPTKEAVCSRYYTSRLDSLRNAAVQSFHSEAISTPLNKLTVMINEKNKLDIKADRNIHLDLVLQRSLLELLLCYNPLWLRIGLEVVFNVQLNLNSNHDIYGMSRFILTNMFKSPYLAEKYNKFSQQKEYLEKLRKFTVKNFLFIIFFLDRAKESRLIKQNPCLFVKKAPYKESNEILKKFASLVLANYGDIIRMLRRFEFTLTHKQTVIDEFDYAFKNLAVDLRDGVRLTKVMEIILLRDDLVQKVRVPAISRLQKVYNVDLALKALEAADYQILGNITSKDIADGHREKTLSLLWQIIYKFRAPRFNAAAKTIQKFWRAKYLTIVVDRRVKEKQDAAAYSQLLQVSAINMQRRFRAKQAMKEFVRLKTAATSIQRKYRATVAMKMQRNIFVLTKTSVIIVQQKWRAIIEMRKQRNYYQNLKQVTTRIQQKFRANRLMKLERDEFQQKKKAATKIQRFYRSYQATKLQRKAFARLRSSVVILQQRFRATLLMRKQQEIFHNSKLAAIKIQRFWRGFEAMKTQKEDFQRIKASTIKMQQRFRAKLSMQKAREDFTTKRAAAVKIQRFWKATIEMRKQRKEYQRTVKRVVWIQQRFRAIQSMKAEKAKFTSQKRSAITIQRFWRGFTEAKNKQNEFQQIKTTTIKIQQRFRANRLMKLERAKYQLHKEAAIKIQRFFRSSQAMKLQREQFNILRSSVINIQRRFRANLAMRQQRESFQCEKRAAIKIQRFWRGFRETRNQQEKFLRIKTSTIKMQQRFRANRLMKLERCEYQQQLHAATKIQRFFRSRQEMQQQREQFVILRSSVIVVQQRFRANLAMRIQRQSFICHKRAVIKIQRFWRGFRAMNHQQAKFLQIQTTTIKIQRRFRANKMMKLERNKFQQKTQAATMIQRFFRSHQVMKQERENFTTLRSSVIAVQRRFRANLAMRKQRECFMNIKRAVIKIQRFWRSFATMKQQQEKFLQIKTTTISIQRRFRANRLMKLERYSYQQKVLAVTKIQRFYRSFKETKQQEKQFKVLRSSVIIVQQQFRAKLSMRKQRQTFLNQKRAVIQIQQFWRGFKAMKEKLEMFQEIKTTTIKLQQRFRANRLMKLERCAYQQKLQAATKIQRFFRSYQTMKQQRKTFVTLRSSVVVVQQRFRATLMMHKLRESFLTDKLSAIKIQRFWRGFEAMKTQKEDFQRIKASTIKIQQRFRAKLSMQKAREDFTTKRAAAVKIQRFWKATIEMRKQRKEYQRTVKRVVWIQQRFRAIQSMKAEKEKFTSQKRSAITIQRWFRSYRLMVVERNKYLEMKTTVLLVENRILANKIMQIERENFVQLRQVAVYIQKRFRSKMETRKTHQQFKETRVMVVKLQSQVRGYQARQRFQEMQTPERIELRQMHKAARSIQAAWRGYQERKNCNHHFRGIVERLIKATKNVDPAQTLASKLKTSINFLKVGYNSIGAISFLAKLEYMSRTVPWILIDDAEFVSLFCYDLMAQAIRSEVDKQIIELCSCIILNLSRYKDTKENAFQEYGLKTISQMLLRWCDKDCGIFNTLCTLVWVFSHCEKKKKSIREFILMKDGEFIVSQIKQNVLRKENMRKNSRRPIGFQSISLVKYKKDYQMQLRYKPESTVYSSGFITAALLQQCREMPSLQPDYGVVKTMPYIFYSSVFAFDNVLKMLGIH